MKKFKQHGLIALTTMAMLFVSMARADDTATATNAATDQAGTNAASTTPTPPTPPEAQTDTDKEDAGRIQREDAVSIGHDAELGADEVANNPVVAVFGSTKVLGHARDEVVAVFGDVDLEGRADGNVVAVFGSIHAGSNAVVRGDAVSVGGVIDRAPGAKFYGHVQETNFNGTGVRDMAWLSNWFKECVLKLRPLSLRVHWIWPIAGIFFLLYLLIAAAFPKAVRPCVEMLDTRPVTALAVGLIGKFVVGIACLLLAVTIIGIIVIPFVQVGLIVAALVGKVAILERIGGGVGKATGVERLQRPVLGFVLGAFIVTVIYTVPILGLLTYVFLSAWGSGAALTAAYIRLRGERPPKTPSAPTGPSPAPAPAYTIPVASAATAATGPLATETASWTPPTPAPDFATASATTSASAIPPVRPVAPIPPFQTGPPTAAFLEFPRGSFWIRMGAGALDCLLVLILILTCRGEPPFFFFAAVCYFTGMIWWKGTTIGGIILRLHVVRTDGRRVTFLVALVRALAAVFSAFCLFLGFFWIGWDRERQGWHDRIAGTVVVRVPHAPSLVCI